jgi:penicillin-binding protein 2
MASRQYRQHFILTDTVRENTLFMNRIIIAWVLMLCGLSLIVVRLFVLQISQHERYTTLSENNRVKVLPLPPTRGFIFDRNGVLLAENRASYSLEIVPEQVEDMDETLTELTKVMSLDEVDVTRFKKQLRQKRHFDSVPLRFKLTEDEVARFSVQRHRFPGVDIASNLNRYYPLGASGVHAIGYVGRINEQELEVIDRANYSGSNHMGKAGVEKYYEDQLHGKVGFQQVETNVMGRVLRILERTPPIPGQNLYLNIDMSLQSFVENLIREERAAVVALDPNTGAVLALASMPYYDPNLFVNGIDPKAYRELRDSMDRPLFNRVLRGQYPPGSTVKAFVGLAGFEYGIRTENSHTPCRGWYTLKDQEHKYRDWKKTGHGSMNFHHAVEQSCDVYFYDLAHDLGIDRLHEFMNKFSFGRKTDIDLPGEMGGLMPSQAWKRRVRKAAWFPGETVITGIGQGYTLATPIQLAVATATLSSHGRFKQPRVAFSLDETSTDELSVVATPPQPKINLRQENYWDVAIHAMEAVVHGSAGTARKLGAHSSYRFAGKTGTAQVVGIKQDEKYDAKKIAKRLHDHALFISFAPLDNPRIAVAVVVENGGSGSGVAGPIAKQVMDYYLLPDSPLHLAPPEPIEHSLTRNH